MKTVDSKGAHVTSVTMTVAEFNKVVLLGLVDCGVVGDPDWRTVEEVQIVHNADLYNVTVTHHRLKETSEEVEV